jgi:hypothetical protein
VRAELSVGTLYLTVSREKRQPENDGYIAVITDGNYQAGDFVTVLDVEIVQNMKEAKAWFRQMKIERPWEPRN